MLLLIVPNGLRSRFAYRNLRAHFPQAHSERFNLLLLFGNGRILLLHFAVRFQKLVEQHRVHFVIADDASTQNALPTMMINAFLVFI